MSASNSFSSSSSSSASSGTTGDESLTTASTPSFTCFPKLPAELQIIIWGYASNQPRNLDIWAPTIGFLNFQWNEQTGQQDYFVFKYYTGQPVPGVLHANQQSRAVVLQFYELSFGTRFDFGSSDNLTISFPVKIYLNFEADRICPMGIWERDARLDLCWGDLPPPSSCAINVRTLGEKWNLHQPPHDCEEIFLYYCEISGFPGTVNFIELSEDTTTIQEWAKLCQGRDTILRRMKREEEIVRDLYFQRDKSLPEGFDTLFKVPMFKLVAIVVGGVRD